MIRIALRRFTRYAVLAGALALGGCDTQICFFSFCFGGSPPSPAPQDAPGTYSYYAQEAFTYQSAFCLISTDSNCTYIVQNNLAKPLSAAGWPLNNGITDGYINGSWTAAETTAGLVIGDQSNLVYISTHGGTASGKAVICLRDCNGSAVGGTVAVGTTSIPQHWSGPTWLILDACQATVPGVGWEGIFGGHLHGILGYTQNTNGLNLGGYSTLAKLIIGYDTAVDAWEQAVAAGGDTSLIGMLVGNVNTQDRIEARGGPHFGFDGSTSLVFYSCCAAQAGVVTSSVARLGASTSNIYSLTPEQVNESYWYNLYGGANVPHSLTYPSSNEHGYRNPYVLVEHYLASGGMIVAAEPTGTARGLSESDAYNYAASWIQSNGGIPLDAVLTLGGGETVSPTQLPTVPGGAYPNIRQYVFVWRHQSSGVMAGDKVQLGVDDDGSWEIDCTETDFPPRVHCYRTNNWNASPHLTTYVRIWRSIGISTASVLRASYSLPPQLVPSSPSGSALCSSDIAAPQSVATPCDVYTTSAGNEGYVDPSSGALIATSERM